MTDEKKEALYGLFEGVVLAAGGIIMVTLINYTHIKGWNPPTPEDVAISFFWGWIGLTVLMIKIGLWFELATRSE